jgi:uncharacterized protein (DUF58 family)
VALVGACSTTAGYLLGWPGMAVAGITTLLLVVGAAGYVTAHPRLVISRVLELQQVEKGSAAEAVVIVTNPLRRRVAARPIRQWIADAPNEAMIPRLAPGETVRRVFAVPTARRGRFELSPVELPRNDPFGLFASSRRLGRPTRIDVHPRIVAFGRLPAAVSLNVEGPTSDLSPQGSTTFHRLREYVVGDDLRTVHWPSTARAGRLVVRHLVDTAQPRSVVVLDVSPLSYQEETFEEAVDVAASITVAMSVGRAPVELRTTAGLRAGGSGGADRSNVLEHLTDVAITEDGSLGGELATLRSGRGGSSLIVVTGTTDPQTLPSVSSMKRRFHRVVLVSVSKTLQRWPVLPGVTVVAGGDADEVSRRWNGSDLK